MLENIPLIEEGDKDKATRGDSMKVGNKLIILKQAQQRQEGPEDGNKVQAAYVVVAED